MTAVGPRQKKLPVTLYTGPACPYCLLVKRYLDANAVEYREVDVSKDRAARAELEKISGQTGVPVVDIEGTAVVGFSIAKLREALRAR